MARLHATERAEQIENVKDSWVASDSSTIRDSLFDAITKYEAAMLVRSEKMAKENRVALVTVLHRDLPRKLLEKMVG